MILPIYVYGSEQLRKKSVKIDQNYPNIKQIIQDMWDTMNNADGVGLAAPQIGKSISVLIVDGAALEKDKPECKDFKRLMINIELLEESQNTVEYSEGCLSVPGVNADIRRAESIKVKYFDENFKEVVECLTGFCARMVLHEIDHLEGILYTDRAAPIRKKILAAKLHKMTKGQASADYKIKM